MTEVYTLLSPVNNESHATHVDPSSSRYFSLEENVAFRNKFWYLIGRHNQRLDEELEKSSAESGSGESEDEFDQNSPEPFHLGEVIKPGENVPAQFTFSFVFPYVQGHLNFYQGGLILQLLDLIRVSVDQVFHLNEKTISACVFTRKPSKRDNKYVVELKIQYPHLRTTHQTMVKKVKPIILNRIEEIDMGSFFGLTLENSWNDILNFDHMKSSMPIYGGDNSINPFRIKGNYLFKNGEYKLTDLSQVFDPTLHQDYQRQIFQPGNPHKVDLWEPLYYSKVYLDQVTRLKDVRNLKPHHHRFVINQAEGEKIARTKQYLNMISGKRFNHRDNWKDIGKALYHISKGKRQGKDLWIEATQQLSSKFTREECEYYYDRFSQKEHHITIRTLAWYARKDDPNQFEDHLEDRFSQMIAEALGDDGEEFEVSRALAMLLELDYVCIPKDSRSYKWYKYRSSHWELLIDESKLLDYISVQFHRHLRACRDNLLNAKANATEERERDIASAKIKELRKYLRQAKQLNSKKRLLKHSMSALIRPNFEELLDSDWSLFGVRNGVIKTNKSRAVFREGKPEDYVHRRSKVPYRKSFHWNHPKVREVMNWWTEILPDPKERNYFIKILSTLLAGGNENKIGIFLVSDTNGGKSKLAEFINIILEQYNGTLPEEELTSRRFDSSKANPFLAQNMEMNVVWVNECEGQINDKTWKTWTGGDATPNRGLYKDGTTNKIPRFTLLITSNFTPNFFNSDDSTIGRAVIFFFKSLWVADPPKSREEQFRKRRFKRDVNFRKKLPGMSPAGLWILVNYYQVYRKEGLDAPEGIRKALNEYWKKNDLVGVFIQDHIRYRDYEKKQNPYTTTDDIYDCYRHFMEKQYSGLAIQIKSRFITVLRQRFKKKGWKPEFDGKGWKDISLLH